MYSFYPRYAHAHEHTLSLSHTHIADVSTLNSFMNWEGGASSKTKVISGEEITSVIFLKNILIDLIHSTARSSLHLRTQL